MNTPSILIVDDLPDHIAFAGGVLRKQGYKVYAVQSGEAAVKFIENKLPDLIVLDINMQGMSGFDVCRAIKSNPKSSSVPVIFLTAESSIEKIREGFELGCCDYVHKPFVVDEYLARINTHLRLSRQQKELEESYNELNNFCSAVSHDLKAPLNVISLLIETLKNELGENITDEVVKILGMIDSKSSQLTKMIERLLEFSRMVNISPDFVEIDMNALILQAFNDQKSLSPERNIKLICGDIPSVKGDSELVTTMIRNIIQNSIKFTSKRANAVIIVDGYIADDNIYISIKDNGAGFDMKYSDRLFDIFQRLHEQEEFEGSGVGLALCSKIMKRHNGNISIKGEVDKGAVVTLSFPAYS